MADIATVWNSDTGYADWVLSFPHVSIVQDETGASVLDTIGAPIADGDPPFIVGQGLLAGNDLATSVLISLFTDATAGLDDVIPDGSNDPRGWAGDPDIGSKIWLRLRSKRSVSLLALVQDDARSALQWLIDDGVASSIDLSTEWQAPSRLAVQVVIRRFGARSITVKYSWAWEGR
jgi:phage gp46-like protein